MLGCTVRINRSSSSGRRRVGERGRKRERVRERERERKRERGGERDATVLIIIVIVIARRWHPGSQTGSPDVKMKKKKQKRSSMLRGPKGRNKDYGIWKTT